MSNDPFKKPEKDFTETLNEQFVQIDALSKAEYKTGLDKLLLLEKQTRQASDVASSKRVLVKIIDVLVNADDWPLLEEQIAQLSKKHGQLKDSIQSMMKEVIENLDKIKDIDLKIKVIETIRVVCENKIFVEIERAQVTKILSDILLNEKNDLDKACEVLSELQVETYASMELEDKIKYILEQMKLNNMRGDYQFSKILSRKILIRSLEKFWELKLRYYELIIEIAKFENNYEDIVKYNMSIYNIPAIQGDLDGNLKYLKEISNYLILTPYSNLQNDLISRVLINKNLSKLPKEYELIHLFTNEEIISWKEFKTEGLNKDIFNEDTEKGKLHLEDLKKRVIEFNLRMISKYYSSVKLDRLCELVELTQQETEDYIIELVNRGEIHSKIDRPRKIVKFIKTKSENELLNEWSQNIEELLENIEAVQHLITKEEMMAK
ncbi:proteasome regulatory particle lid subunit [Pichia kluyveri]|uniref:Proteasome regulatory particle lid subunit n=1 Tax=Pichia kluyveri TaxID=36015 RepID=A0AAV5R237_PICKL|nr:proteasome regulatory particle lid subunit [Pichia kluyveri]